jgi:hypothetical protein
MEGIGSGMKVGHDFGHSEKSPEAPEKHRSKDAPEARQQQKPFRASQALTRKTGKPG